MRRVLVRRFIFASPFSVPAPLGLRRRFDFDENNVHPDFRNVFQFDKEFRSAEAKTFSAGDNDALYFSLRIGKHYVAHSSEPLAVAKIYRLFPS